VWFTTKKDNGSGSAMLKARVGVAKGSNARSYSFVTFVFLKK